MFSTDVEQKKTLVHIDMFKRRKKLESRVEDANETAAITDPVHSTFCSECSSKVLNCIAVLFATLFDRVRSTFFSEGLK